ncbi:MAG: glutamine--fructose-6-phosphate transaminase (isomerizing) [Candidatus Roizmanbacteria bacterium]|nr:glutamine--fructose-6-phosphate transaminase (isomerizing) [Candidatus Roizmanbacteria bacterium]
MCGIFGYIGDSNASEMIVRGLKRLEYRGYDSWGIAVAAKHTLTVVKQVGPIGDVEKALTLPSSHAGLGHTRWATHGRVTQRNAHPHFSTDKSFALAQNGIVENYKELQKQLFQLGYTFHTETDTEVIVRLIEYEQTKTTSLLDAVKQAFKQLSGRNTIALITTEGEIIAARNGSPLVVGRNTKNGTLYISSDTLSFAPYVDGMYMVDNGQLIRATKSEVSCQDIQTGKSISMHYEHVSTRHSEVDKAGYEHYMLKEIHENPQVIAALLKQPAKEYERLAQAIKRARRVYAVGSGTAGIAAAQIAFYLREYAHIDAVGLVGADAKEYYDYFTPDDLIIAPSQSGETADVLEVIEHARIKKAVIASFVNMPGSMMSRLSDFAFMAQAGPEICVMSTKIFVSQIAWGYLLAKTVANKRTDALKQLEKLSHDMGDYLQKPETHKQLKEVARILVKKHDIFLMGKYQNLQIVREGMVKFIEGTYKHAHAIAAGDLKHYAITLMEKGVIVVTALSRDSVYSDMMNAMHEVKARGATVIGISADKEEGMDIHIPVPKEAETSAIMHVVPLQLLAYYMAKKLGNNIDRPRNIAKSVTVK